MCELFAMTSREPANVSLSLAEFSRHGGLSAKHGDGWGIAYYHGSDAQIIREACPAFDSAQMQFVKNRSYESTLVISHIRKATMGEIALRNTQPFSRELNGRLFVFSHNGAFHDIQKILPLESDRFIPLGETDSEHAFCILMTRIQRLFEGGTPSFEQRLEVITTFAHSICALGPANFIVSDSEYIYCHGDRRTHADGIRPPGLHYLSRSCKTEPQPVIAEGLSISTTAESQDIVLVASVPLTEEGWRPFEPGQMLVLKDGLIVG
jgi:predicted glutamine amidotransferase